jgi:hypothetical protein
MVCSRVYEIGKTELANIPEALEYRGVEQVEGIRGDLDIPMHRVLYDLHLAPKQSWDRADKGIE